MIQYKTTIGTDGKKYHYKKEESATKWTRVSAASIATTKPEVTKKAVPVAKPKAVPVAKKTVSKQKATPKIEIQKEDLQLATKKKQLEKLVVQHDSLLSVADLYSKNELYSTLQTHLSVLKSKMNALESGDVDSAINITNTMIEELKEFIKYAKFSDDEKAKPKIESLKQIVPEVKTQSGCDDIKKQVAELKALSDKAIKEYQLLESAGKMTGELAQYYKNTSDNYQRRVNVAENARSTYQLKYENLKRIVREEFVHRKALAKYCENNPKECNVLLNTDAYVLKESLADQEKYFMYIRDLIFVINLDLMQVCRGNESADEIDDCIKVRPYSQKVAWARDHAKLEKLLKENRV